MYNNPTGIKGLIGREPIGAAVTIGKKQKNGFPKERDRFHIVNPRDTDGIRDYHPAFKAFNTAEPDRRKVLRGVLVHAVQDECFTHHLKMQVMPGKKAHPNMKPACLGNGVRAIRWENGMAADESMEIKCLNEKCEFRQPHGDKIPCKPWAQLLFRLRWPEGTQLPTPLVKFTTGSWNTVANLKGFFEHLEKMAHNLGIAEPSLFGIPFVLSLQDQTQASKQARFPVVHITPDMNIDPAQFFLAQRQNIEQLQQTKLITLPDMTDNEIFEDVEQISVPSK